MIIYKYKLVNVKQDKNIYLVKPGETNGNPGLYTIHDVTENSTYHVTIEHGDFNGDVRLWLADEKNKVLEFSPKYDLTSNRRQLEYCLDVGTINKLKVGLLFNKPQKENFFQLVSMKVQRVNIPTNKKRLAIIVPYRDRMEHLKTFVPFMNKYLKEYDSQIFIVHQKNDKPFNRAALMNIGYHIVKDSFDYFCFHDIDLIAEASSYSYPSKPAHLSMYCSQFNYKRKSIFGGVVLFTKEQFEKINGFSNLYQGWGGEDDDLRLRVKQHYIPEYRPGRYTSLAHKHAGSTHPNYKQNLNMYLTRKKDSNLFKNDGLSEIQKTFKYQILEYNGIDKDCNLTNEQKIKYKNKADFMIDVNF